jgi:superfamily II DNA or RNA helicase
MDDVLKSIRAYARRHRDPEERKVTPPVELTSRVPSSDIPSILAQLEQPGPGNGAVDVLLASNMLSVGVDIRRLGLMVVAAQPKTMAEYIQATSRVGRHAPGLVVVVYNNPRVRDRSHYESFPTWHSALYRTVEATSVTPLASRARDKALHAVLVSLARHLVPALRDDPRLGSTTVASVLGLLGDVLARVRRVDSAEESGTRAGAEEFLQDWERRTGPGLQAYWDEKHPDRALLIGAEQAASLEEQGQFVEAWPTPNSMREVEPSSLFRIKYVERAESPRRRKKPNGEG